MMTGILRRGYTVIISDVIIYMYFESYCSVHGVQLMVFFFSSFFSSSFFLIFARKLLL